VRNHAREPLVEHRVIVGQEHPDPLVYVSLLTQYPSLRSVGMSSCVWSTAYTFRATNSTHICYAASGKGHNNPKIVEASTLAPLIWALVRDEQSQWRNRLLSAAVGSGEAGFSFASEHGRMEVSPTEVSLSDRYENLCTSGRWKKGTYA